MKKILVLAAAIALVSSTAFAAGTATLNVTANVVGTCTITGGNLVFGALDPTTALAVGPIAATGVAVNCTNSTPFTVTDNAAAMPLDNAGSQIPFTLTHANGGTGTGALVAYGITGNIAAGVYSTSPSGAYASSVTLTIIP